MQAHASLARKPKAAAALPKAAFRAPARRAVTEPALQAKLRIGPVDDPLERDADRVADAVVAGRFAAPFGDDPEPGVRRKCAACEVEEKRTLRRKCAECEAGEDWTLHRKCAECEGEEDTLRREAAEQEDEEPVRLKQEGHAMPAAGAEAAASAVARGGSPLPRGLRSYFEPRMGRGLGDVRIHTDATAGTAARAIGARAYTLGRDIGFAAGEYAPATREGRRLIAHELAHVAQECVAPPATIRRTVARSSACRANAHGAPADPLATLRDLDERAQLMSLGASRALGSEALSIREGLGPGEVSRAYRRRFGRPIALAGGQFRDRFTGAVHPSEVATTSAEMQLLSVRYELLARFFADPVRYFCPGFSVFEEGDCAPHTCQPNEAAAVCPALPGLMLICPEFWALPPDERSGAIVHEAAHTVWTFGPHQSGTPGQRARNPECYNNFLADLFGYVNARSASCDALP